MKTMTRRPVPDNNLIKSVRKLGPLCGLSGPALVIVLLFSWFLASCGTVSKQSQPLPPDFGLSTSPGTLTIAQGSNGSSTITVAPQNAFSGNVNLAVSRLPNGVTASFSTNPTTPTSTMSTLTLTASSTAATGMSTVTITGTSGTLSHTTTLALTVNTTVSTLTVTPTTLSFNYQIGSAVPGAQSVSVTASPAALSFTASTSGGTWLSAAPMNGTTPGTVSVTVNPASLTRSEEHTSELSHGYISYAVFCLKK